jgi:hypothetical protein
MVDDKKISFLDKAKKKSGSSSSVDKILKKSQDDKNFMDQLIKSRADMCYKVVGRDSTGREAYYFVLIDKDKKQQFLKHKVGDTYNLEDYGRIVYSAYGTKVPKEVKEMLKDKYGFDNLGNDDDEDDEEDQIYFSAADFDFDDDEISEENELKEEDETEKKPEDK